MAIPVAHSNSIAHRRLIAQAVNSLIPTVKEVTLTTSSTTTTVTDEKMGVDKTVILIPTTADAASESVYLSSKLNGSFVLTHSSSATSRVFDYIII